MKNYSIKEQNKKLSIGIRKCTLTSRREATKMKSFSKAGTKGCRESTTSKSKIGGYSKINIMSSSS